ncbi:MAG: hypothetical protein JNG85_04345 [Spirochaetaceae bacterium]|nr:hypothetical protein [Spirochaetaceae bacterium]
MDRDQPPRAGRPGRPGLPLKLFLALALFPALETGVMSLVMGTSIPLFLDSTFTALSAALLGPWWGAATGLAMQLVQEALHGFPWVYAPFALCSAATALLVGLAARNGRFGTALDLAVVALGTAGANAGIGAALVLALFGGGSGSNIDILVAGFKLVVRNEYLACLLPRIPINIVDKGLSVGAAFLLCKLLSPRLGPLVGRAAAQSTSPSSRQQR